MNLANSGDLENRLSPALAAANSSRAASPLNSCHTSPKTPSQTAVLSLSFPLGVHSVEWDLGLPKRLGEGLGQGLSGGQLSPQVPLPQGTRECH